MKPKRKAMSESAEAFYLRLNNHKRFMTGALTELYQNETLVDCTLSAQGRYLRAHRTVLAACSPYFKDIFTECQSSSQLPVVIIKDMPFADLKAIVDYIYCGEVTIPRRQLQSVLDSGATLQVKGLHEFNRNMWTQVIESDAETGADDEYECDYETDSASIDDQNIVNYSVNNSINSCEPNGNSGPNKKRTRKSRDSTEQEKNSSNGCHRELEKFGKTLSLNDVKDNNNIASNDEITGNNNNINQNIKREYSEKSPIKLMNESQTLTKNSEESYETGLESALINTNGKHNMEKSMTGKTVENTGSATASAGPDNIGSLMPFSPLQQSVMIDVKSNVNQALHNLHLLQLSSVSMSGLSNQTIATTTTTGVDTNSSHINSMTDNKTTEKLEKQNQSQSKSNLETKDQNICGNNIHIIDELNEIPALQVVDVMTFESNKIQTKIQNKSLISKTVEENNQRFAENKTSKESKAGKSRRCVRNDRRFECPYCKKVYVSPQNMKEHLRNIHTNPQQKHKCSVCQKQYSWKHALDRHIKTKHTAN